MELHLADSILPLANWSTPIAAVAEGACVAAVLEYAYSDSSLVAYAKVEPFDC